MAPWHRASARRSHRHGAPGALATLLGLLAAAVALATRAHSGAWLHAQRGGSIGGGSQSNSPRGFRAARCATSVISLSELEGIPLRRLENGSMADPSGTAILAGELWRKTGAVVHVVRRAG